MALLCLNCGNPSLTVAWPTACSSSVTWIVRPSCRLCGGGRFWLCFADGNPGAGSPGGDGHRLRRVALAEMGTVDILASCPGALVPDDNPYAFSLELARVLNDRLLRQQLLADARAYAAEGEAMAGRMAEVYRTLAGRGCMQRAA